MTDLDTKMVIDKIVDDAYNRTIERLNAIEGAPQDMIFRSILVEKGNYRSYLMSFLHYYCGCFEGILFTRFLDAFDRAPTSYENSIIKDATETRFEELKKAALDVGDKKFTNGF